MPKSKEYLSESSGSDSDAPKTKKTKKMKAEKPKEGTKDSSGAVKGDRGENMYPMGNEKFVSVSEFKGKLYVNVREYYEKDGKRCPGKKGIALNMDQWKKLKDRIEDIDSDLSKH